MYARVVVDADGASQLDSFTYEIPGDYADAAVVGACVLVPFGKTQAIGYVVELDHTAPEFKTKPIQAVIESPITLSPYLVGLSQWISGRYICGLSRCAHSILPGVVQCKIKTLVETTENRDNPDSELYSAIAEAGGSVTMDWIKSRFPNPTYELSKLQKKWFLKKRYQLVTPDGKAKTAIGAELAVPIYEAAEQSELIRDKAPRQAEILDYLAAHGTSLCANIANETGASLSAISALVDKGLVRKLDIPVRRRVSHTKMPSTAHFELSSGQQTALQTITEGISGGTTDTVLMHGVTASGKTEVYLRSIEHARSLGRKSLVMLPEIALTTQVLNIFASRFGDRVAVLHSNLSAGERFDEWKRAEDGEADVVLGARSAVFAPISDVGLIIVDEEHEPSYKQDSDPRYHGRDVALHRAADNGAIAVLGSATPSVESYYRAKQGKYKLVTMAERIENRPMPIITVADLRDEFKKGKATIFSDKLSDAMAESLAKGQQVILFQNRRAYATFLLCRECGYTALCPHCAVSLKLHASERILRCHHCDYEQPAPDACPDCGGLKIGKFGIGTERIEEETKTAFPSARVLRMDRDTTIKKGSHAAILDAFRRKEADVLVGTQMIAKGLDFPGVTLVGVISADTSLNLPDYRAGERTFQLLSQVAGRAGRGEEPGEVVIQTFNPEHYAVVAAAAHDYESFYEQEIETRMEHGFPPFGHVVNIVASDVNETDAMRRLTDLVNELEKKMKGKEQAIEILGPAPSPVARLRGRFRWHVMLKSSNRDYMVDTLKASLDALPSVRRGVVVDIDPSSML